MDSTYASQSKTAIHTKNQTHPKPRRKRWNTEDAVAVLMLAPKFIIFSAFVLYPIFWVLRFMFFNFNGISDATFVGFDNFVRAFMRDPIWWRAVGNTFVFATGKLVIEIPLALVLAVFLNSKIKGKGLLRGAFFLPTVTSAAVMSLVFTFIFSPYNGALNNALKGLNLIDSNVLWLDTPAMAMISVIIVSIWQIYGQNVILLLAGLQNIPSDVEESAKIDGANSVQIFFKITLPMLAPMLQLILMLAITGTLASAEIPMVLTNGGPNNATTVMGLQIFRQFFLTTGLPSYGYGAALAFISACIIGMFTIVYFRVSRKMNYMEEQ